MVVGTIKIAKTTQTINVVRAGNFFYAKNIKFFQQNVGNDPY